jgi:hypothetical protein
MKFRTLQVGLERKRRGIGSELMAPTGTWRCADGYASTVRAPTTFQ